MQKLTGRSGALRIAEQFLRPTLQRGTYLVAHSLTWKPVVFGEHFLKDGIERARGAIPGVDVIRIGRLIVRGRLENERKSRKAKRGREKRQRSTLPILEELAPAQFSGTPLLPSSMQMGFPAFGQIRTDFSNLAPAPGGVKATQTVARREACCNAVRRQNVVCLPAKGPSMPPGTEP